MKTNLLPLALVAAALISPVRAATESYTFNPSAAVPDGTVAGLADAHTLSSSLLSLTDVNVTLNLSSDGDFGAFNGDLYATLVHSSGFSVLLNRVGRTATAAFGYSDSGLSVTLDDQAATDIHSYRLAINGDNTAPLQSLLTGSFLPDARITDPSDVDVTDPRADSAKLSDFNGLAGSGEWVLFVADTEAGGQVQLDSWTLDLVGTSEALVPEASTVAAGAMLSGLAAWSMWRRRRQA